MKENLPIYLQLANSIMDKIAVGNLKSDDRIPSVRELAAKYEVNAATALKSIEHLAQNQVIYNKRGLGYFVNSNADEKILTSKRKEFTDKYLPELLHTMKMLGMDFDQLKQEAEKLTHKTQESI